VTPTEGQTRPSGVFGLRLREIRRARGLTQAALADLVTAAGQPLDKAAVLRIERGGRGVSLDEALALAWVLGVAPLHLLSPPDGQVVWVTRKAAVDGAGLRNWALFGDALLLSAEGRRVKGRIRLVLEVEGLAQALVDAKRGGDSAGAQAAAQALKDAIISHQRQLGAVGEEEEK